MMSRRFSISGIVVHGDARGRELGFPTANVAVEDGTILPPDGIYAGWLKSGQDVLLPSAISIGKRPMFYQNAVHSLVEVHVLDWSGDLYGKTVVVEFAAFLRNEMRFDCVKSMINQMHLDCDAAREVLG